MFTLHSLPHHQELVRGATSLLFSEGQILSNLYPAALGKSLALGGMAQKQFYLRVHALVALSSPQGAGVPEQA